jgi:hypothetical protein
VAARRYSRGAAGDRGAARAASNANSLRDRPHPRSGPRIGVEGVLDIVRICGNGGVMRSGGEEGYAVFYHGHQFQNVALSDSDQN